ncbi:hypothetical protein [Streptomyces sp. NPDC001404]|uniref:hypothetical protein n=1 Tax=Streptomyces sp. NPDC001404 TaxID=3364571 RepID=UPI0036A67163
MDTPDTVENPEADQKTRRKSPPPVEPRVEPAPVTEPTQPSTQPEGPVPGWLRYTGQTAAVFLDLGGEITPGAVVHPDNASLSERLLERGDFEAAEPPASDAFTGTAH